jgi:8-hydroxy-5-deazaflavin:NADPH oxidoreductase
MKIGILGTGEVGVNLATKLSELGHQVMLGSRTAGKAKGLAVRMGTNASGGDFAQAAAFGEVVFNCTHGSASVDALKSAGAGNLDGKVLVDVANPLNFENGQLTLWVANTDSLAEQIQRAFPATNVVKAFNTMNYRVQTNPKALSEETDVFICGNDPAAKAKVAEILGWFGWKRVVDLGGIQSARGMEAILLIWYDLSKKYGFAPMNFKFVK